MQRRELFPILGLAAAQTQALLAQHAHPLMAKRDLTAYEPRVLNKNEYLLLDRFTELLLPADETGPGAHDAHVAYYLDTVLKFRPAAEQQAWRDGLASLNALAKEAQGEVFLECSREQQVALLTGLAEREPAPTTVAERFFRDCKRAAIEAFYLSDRAQRDHLGYKGHTAIADFAGCTHDHSV